MLQVFKGMSADYRAKVGVSGGGYLVEYSKSDERRLNRAKVGDC